MPEVVTLARAARESLARGLSALQEDVSLPPHLRELAAPIAQAMGALHQVERSGGAQNAQIAPYAQTALASVQAALAQLQTQPGQHPGILSAMEAVAGALGSVHALVRQAAAAPVAPPQPQAPPPQAPAPARQPTQQRPVAPGPAAYGGPAAQGPIAQQLGQQVPQQRSIPAQVMTPQPFVPQAPQAYAQPPQPSYAPQQPFPQPPQVARPVIQQAVQQAPPRQGASRTNPMQASPPGRQDGPPPGMPGVQQPGRPAPANQLAPIAAELGAHSPSNFYKGLAGNDIIDHGGLFVSTYKLPPIGQPVRLRVSLPGGYEFEANAIVRWRREATDAGNDAPPGFGAQFTDIAPEARQLVYRYVRNREPMFHDDL